MKVCPNCGWEIPDKSKKCPGCGTLAPGEKEGFFASIFGSLKKKAPVSDAPAKVAPCAEKRPIGAPDFYLLEWQNVITGHPSDGLTMTRTELEYWSHSMARDSIRIIQDSSRIIHETKDPEVFFSRFDLLEQHYGFLCTLSKFIKTTNEPPEAVLAALRETKQEEIYRFISRYYADTFAKAQALKTENGKKNRFQKFCDSLQPYIDEMDDHNRNYVNYKYKGAMKMVDKM